MNIYLCVVSSLSRLPPAQLLEILHSFAVRSCHVVRLHSRWQQTSFILGYRHWEFIKAWNVYNYCHFQRGETHFLPQI